MSKEITIKIKRRADDGLHIYSDEVPGLILSGLSPEKMMAATWPALVALKAEPKNDF